MKGGVCCCFMMLQIDKCPNEDLGALPGPRCLKLSALTEFSSGTFMACCTILLDDMTC